MSEDETQKFDASDGDRLDQLISLVQAMSLDIRDVKTRLAALEQKVEERLYDTRPIWESVQTHIVELHQSQERMNEEQARIREEQEKIREEQEKIREEQEKIREEQEKIREEQEKIREEMQAGFRRLDHKIGLISGEIRELYADQRETDRRVDELEKRVS
ncbi:MAG: hypothetical protein L0229_29905 [Blastocatellia bacterium]|nr:hypothetical protein [Blastocatellia bacterium]